mmetsp:Transcript_34347/g.110312  ORF Transcript_34347/g.110312 Transcript_34347/m.110312 type:complete len:119 (+) Transcript_34347:58-414(+)
MPLEIPPPEVHGDAKYTWKATAEQLPWKEGEAKVVLYRYEIFHEDGTKTVRTVTETDGVKETTEERKEVGGKAAVPQKKPIDPPKDLPEKATCVSFLPERTRGLTDRAQVRRPARRLH